MVGVSISVTSQSLVECDRKYPHVICPAVDAEMNCKNAVPFTGFVIISHLQQIVVQCGSFNVLNPVCFHVYFAFSALTLLVGRQEGRPACKKLSSGVLAWLSVWSEVQTCIWPS